MLAEEVFLCYFLYFFLQLSLYSELNTLLNDAKIKRETNVFAQKYLTYQHTIMKWRNCKVLRTAWKNLYKLIIILHQMYISNISVKKNRIYTGHIRNYNVLFTVFIRHKMCQNWLTITFFVYLLGKLPFAKTRTQNKKKKNRNFG